MCKVKWGHHSEEEATWEREDDMKVKYLELFASQLSHPVLEGKPNANHVPARIRNSRTQRLHSWTSSHIARNNVKIGTLLHHDVQGIHKVINLSHNHNQSVNTKHSTIRQSQAVNWGFATNLI